MREYSRRWIYLEMGVSLNAHAQLTDVTMNAYAHVPYLLSYIHVQHEPFPLRCLSIKWVDQGSLAYSVSDLPLEPMCPDNRGSTVHVKANLRLQKYSATLILFMPIGLELNVQSMRYDFMIEARVNIIS